MNKRMIVGALALAATLAAPALAQTSMSTTAPMAGSAMKANPMVGGAPMLASKNIVENAVNSKDHTTLVSLVKKAGLVETLSGPGPFTVFAPTNEAFAKIPSATLTKVGDDKALLTKVLTYHVVAGKLDSAAIAAKIKAGGGKAMLKTVQGEDLTAMMDGDKLVLTDAHGGKSTVTIADVMQSNGVIHVVDTVLMP
jgi:uncharacterized surface protein with fasciclin (FAS1) repeats